MKLFRKCKEKINNFSSKNLKMITCWKSTDRQNEKISEIIYVINLNIWTYFCNQKLFYYFTVFFLILRVIY